MGSLARSVLPSNHPVHYVHVWHAAGFHGNPADVRLPHPPDPPLAVRAAHDSRLRMTPGTAEKRWIVGVDLGGTNIVVGLVPIAGGDVLGLRTLSTDSHRGAKFVVDRIVGMVEEAIVEVTAAARHHARRRGRGGDRLAGAAGPQDGNGHQHAQPGVAQLSAPRPCQQPGKAPLHAGQRRQLRHLRRVVAGRRAAASTRWSV